MRISYGIRIFTDDNYISSRSITPEKAGEIGIYEVSGEYDQIRWVTDHTPFLEEEWKIGNIIEGSVRPVTSSVDLRRTGNINTWGGTRVSVDNTGKLYKSLEDLDIYLNGLKTELIEFNLDTEEERKLYTGICYVTQWDTTDFTLSIDIPKDKRKANISRVINNSNTEQDLVTNKIFSVVYGEVKTAAFTRTNDEVNLVDTGDYFTSELTDKGISFPAVFNYASSYEKDPTLNPLERTEIIIRLSYLMDDTTFTDANFRNKLDLVGKYVYVHEGKGSGQYRKIVDFEVRPNKTVTDYEDGPGTAETHFDLIDYPVISVTVDKYFKEDLECFWYANTENQSWVCFADLKTEWRIDGAGVSGYIDNEGNVVEDPKVIYNNITNIELDRDPITGELTDRARVTEQGWVPIPTYSFSAGADGNSIVMDPEFIEEDTNNVRTIEFVDPEFVRPVADPSLYSKTSDAEENVGLWGFEYTLDRVFKDSTNTAGTPFFAENWTVDIPENTDISQYKDLVTNRRNNSSIHHRVETPAINVNSYPSGWSPTYLYGVELKIPDLSSYDFDNAYLSISLSAQATGDLGPDGLYLNAKTGPIWLVIRSRRFWGGAIDIYSDFDKDTNFRYDIQGGPLNYAAGRDAWLAGNLITFPYNYWEVPPEDDDYLDPNVLGLGATETATEGVEKYRDFFSNELLTNEGNGAPFANTVKKSLRRGYFNLPLIAQDKYFKDEDIGIFLVCSTRNDRTLLDSRTAINFDLREVKIMLEKRNTLSDTLYVGIAGRNTAGDLNSLIRNPISFIEDLVYRQNWSEKNGTPPTDGWGTERYSDPSIKNDGEHGAFNYPDLDFIKSLRISHMITDYSKSWTDYLKKQACKQFWLAQYQDESGNECIDYILDPFVGEANESDTITLSDIVGNITPTKPNDVKDIYVEPTVYYNLDHSTGEYKNSISVNNASAASFEERFVPELANTDGSINETALEIWDRANLLFKKYKQINEAPKELINLDMIVDKEAAAHFLLGWMFWQDRKRIRFKLPYEMARSWGVSKRFKIQLPHQTNNEEVYCIVDKIDKDIALGKRKPTVTVSAIIYNDLDKNVWWIQDTYNDDDEEWDDTYSLFDETINDV